jgi:hypothetical protein
MGGGQIGGLIDISMLFTPVSHDEPVSVRERILQYCFDRTLTDTLYARQRGAADDEDDWIAREYWKRRTPEKQAEKARAEAEAAKDARIAELEREVRALKGEAAETP